MKYASTTKALEILANIEVMEDTDCKPIASVVSALAPAVKVLDSKIADAEITLAEYGTVIANAIASVKGMTIAEVKMVEANSKQARAFAKIVKAPLLDASFTSEGWKVKCPHERRFRNALSTVFAEPKKADDETEITSDDWKEFKKMFPTVSDLENLKTAKALMAKFAKSFDDDSLFKSGLAKNG